MRPVSLLFVALFLMVGCRQPDGLPAPEPPSPVPETLTRAHEVAWDVMASASLVTLITVDEEGQPQARILESLAPDSGRFDVWMGTNRHSAKVREIEQNPRATLFYRISDGTGYVTLRGRATMVDDPAEKERRWRPHWEAFYPDPDEMYVLIHFTPINGEVVSFAHGLTGDSLTWAAPEFGF